jgi:regulator of protease activity HflC (stomatin/prohibitin superfamily)
VVYPRASIFYADSLTIRRSFMSLVIFAILFLICAVVAPRYMNQEKPVVRLVARVICATLAILCVVSTSFVYVGQNETGHLDKIYWGDSLKNGSIIATNGEKGPQADILPPGFHFQPLLNFIYNVTTKPIVEVKDGEYGYLIARDGKSLRPDQTFADAFAPTEMSESVSNASYFLKQNGQKGPQTTVLTPGFYRINYSLWEVTFGKVTEIPQGFVGVIKSNVHSRVDFGNLRVEKPERCGSVQLKEIGGESLSVPLVPVGCIGVWSESLSPGRYYINGQAYKVSLVDTRVQTWEYKGGFKSRYINLEVEQDGSIKQTHGVVEVAVPEHAVDPAISITVEGWKVPQEARILVQVSPDLAPFVVASVGGLQEVEDRIITPAIRSILRSIGGGNIKINGQLRPTQVLDLMTNRGVLEANIEELIKPEGLKAGINIKEVRLGEPVIPPELLLARQREQLAQQLQKSFVQERIAQNERVSTEKARATANQQSKLVEAEIELKKSVQLAQARKNEGLGERDKLNLIAEGQKAQVEVLGEDRVVMLRKFELGLGKIVDFFNEHPDVLTEGFKNAQKFVPERLFMLGGENSNNLTGAAGILGDFLGKDPIKSLVNQKTPDQK